MSATNGRAASERGGSDRAARAEGGDTAGFFNLYNHDLVRVAVALPAVKVADPLYNAEQTIALLRQAAEQQAALVLFPELGLSAYSCEDLFHQRALLDISLEALAAVVEASA